MRVVGQGQRDPGLPAQPDQPLCGLVLLGDAVALDLEIEVILPEELPQIEGAGPGRLIVAVDQRLRDLARETAGEADQPLAVLMQKLPVDARAQVIALGEAGAHQIAEIAVAGLIAAEEDQMGVLVLRPGRLVEAALRRDIDFTADDGLDPLGQTGLVEGDRAVHDAVVRDGESGLAQRLGALGDRIDPAGPVEQRVFGMHM